MLLVNFIYGLEPKYGVRGEFGEAGIVAVICSESVW